MATDSVKELAWFLARTFSIFNVTFKKEEHTDLQKALKLYLSNKEIYKTVLAAEAYNSLQDWPFADCWDLANDIRNPIFPEKVKQKVARLLKEKTTREEVI